MAMNKTLGYVLIGVGLIVFLFSFPAVAALVKIPLPAGLTSNIIMVIGLVVLAVGAFIVSKSGGGEVKEVPIYGGKSGKDVVGFRRIQQ
jgi:hypothetical protein